jgi:hypothetical protein
MTDRQKELVRLNVCFSLAAIPPDFREGLRTSFTRQWIEFVRKQPLENPNDHT